MTDEHPNDAAHGLHRHAEAAVPHPFRKPAGPVTPPPAKPAVTPKPAPKPVAKRPVAKKPVPKKPAPAANKPRQVPNFVLKHSDRGTRIVHTFKGKGIWEVWQEAYESREEIYDAALKDAVPTEGYWMEDGLITDQLGDRLYDGTALPWKWYATLEETETPHGYYA